MILCGECLKVDKVCEIGFVEEVVGIGESLVVVMKFVN